MRNARAMSRSSCRPAPSALAVVASFGLLTSACAVADDPTGALGAAAAPLVGVDGSLDQADRACHVVLRDLGRTGSGGWFETDGSSWVWQGAVEISQAAADEGLTPAALYRMAPSGAWTTVAATPSAAPATPGYARFDLRLSAGLPGPGWSGTALGRAQIEVVPYLPLAEGGRLFDHNRVRDDLGNYVLSAPGLAIEADGRACPAPVGPSRAQLVFAADWSETRQGVLTPGGEVAVVYDPARLPQCRNWRGGNPLYDLTAHVLFAPGGQRHAVSVRDGAPVLVVPADARRMTLWFENTAIPGCQAWDSNLGANYGFDVATAPAWMGEVRTRLSRSTDDPCAGGLPAAGGFVFDPWTRQRAAITNLCFEVYQPGLTDRDDLSGLWQQLDVQLRWRLRSGAGVTPWRQRPVDLDRRVGNNARYRLDWRALDPFVLYGCPEVAPDVDDAAASASVRVDYELRVNGATLGPFAGTFSDYASGSWRAACAP